MTGNLLTAVCGVGAILAVVVSNLYILLRYRKN